MFPRRPLRQAAPPPFPALGEVTRHHGDQLLPVGHETLMLFLDAHNEAACGCARAILEPQVTPNPFPTPPRAPRPLQRSAARPPARG